MFGKIKGIENSEIIVENLSKVPEISLIGIHVVFESDNVKYVGVINNIFVDEVRINLIGEINEDRFDAGIVKHPKLNSACRIITKGELESILGSQNLKDRNTLLIGNSEMYDGFKVTVDKNDFFSSHFAILGNTGSGKSCGMARILQNNFYNHADGEVASKARFVVFDALGEDSKAFESLDAIPGLKHKVINCDYTGALSPDFKIPPYFLDVDDLALLLNIESPDLIPTLISTIRIAYIFTSGDEGVINYQNSVIASSILDILSSGRSSTQMRDQVIAVLTKYHTKDLNLDSVISQPGYDRTLNQCLIIDAQGKINAMNLVVDFLTPFIKNDMSSIDMVPGFVYTLEDLYNALEFSLINEGILTSNKAYDKLNSLKIRLRSIINSDLKKIFEIKEYISKIDFVENFFKEGGADCQVVCVKFGKLDDRTIKMLTKIILRIFFDYASTIPIKESPLYNEVSDLESEESKRPKTDRLGLYAIKSDRNAMLVRNIDVINIVIEEAHRYIQNDSDVNVMGYNIFEKITKEGRKYGMFLGVITQRPMELSKTVLSQCGNVICFRLYHPDDISIVTSLSSHVNQDLQNKLKNLHPGMALCFGDSFSIPLFVQLELPDPMPNSSDVKVCNLWY